MQVAKTMIEKYLYEEVESVFKGSVTHYSLACSREDIDIVYEGLKELSVEITEEVIKNQVLDYLSQSELWLKRDDLDGGLWEKTDLSDLLNYIDSKRAYASNVILEQLVGIIKSIDISMGMKVE